MKLIQGMKLIKELLLKSADLRKKVADHCALTTIETPLYADQKAQVDKWVQAHHDILQEIAKLRVSVQRTNLQTPVTIELGGKQVTKTIAEWIHRRRDLAKLEMDCWQGIGDRGLREGAIPSTQPGQPPTQVKIVRFYDPALRDSAIELYRTEPGVIDRTLEVVNATTDLLET